MTTNELRKKYLDFFQGKGHKLFASDTLVPDDASVLFSSAGMNQFKDYLLGRKKDVTKAVSCQKCLRTGDIERVGQTPCHHTFFEMLGNFSFGDYFKKEAIEFAWEFVTKELNMKPKDLWISVYRGDEEAFDIWKDHIGVLPERMVQLGPESNFWPANAPMDGPNGPCGPCSEIFFDRGADVGCGRPGCDPSCDCRRFIEFWNLVFTQFDRRGVNDLEPLPQKNIDTGMGLERMAAILQGKSSNFEIDIFAPLVARARDVLRAVDNAPKTLSALYSIVDHARAITFAIADGVYPSNEDRGYVIRKLVRKASLAGSFLGMKKAFLYRLVDPVAEAMKAAYPEVDAKKANVMQAVLAEEGKFLYTQKEGATQLGFIAERLKKESRTVVSAEDVFRLYDTFGYPLDAIEETAAKYNLNIEKGEKFQALLKKQQEQSRQKSMFAGSIFNRDGLDIKDKSEFVGYKSFSAFVNAVNILRNGETVKDAKEGEEVLVVLDQTPFFAAGGGQLSDKGWIRADETEFEVADVLRNGAAIVHRGKVVKGTLRPGKVEASVDTVRRKAIARAHTATHLLQAALRKVLGDHVAQQGSQVDEDRLRFDFSHFQAMSHVETIAVEKEVNAMVAAASEVNIKVVSMEEAKKEGALAFFKDKYGDEVRFVAMGVFSKELCGGTHLDNTAGVGLFAIVAESSISSGTRRIEAVTGQKAYEYFRAMEETLEASSALLKVSPNELESAVQKVVEELQREKNNTGNLRREVLGSKLEDIFKSAKEINGISFLGHLFDGADSGSLLSICDEIKGRDSSIFIYLVGGAPSKRIFVVCAGEALVSRGITCDKFVNVYKNELGVKGGGRPNLVQGVVMAAGNDLFKCAEDCFAKFTQPKSLASKLRIKKA